MVGYAEGARAACRRLAEPLSLALRIAVAVAVAVAVAGCGDGPSEDCAIVGDEDGNGRADCDDPACAGEPACQPACGNGKIDAGEACDDGNLTSGDGCDANCTPTKCGNGVRTLNEGCDDGNAKNGDGCDTNCMVTGCGNGVRAPNELCDDGNTTSGDGCDNNCTTTKCGNGVRTTGELCDDGNATNGDGCDSNCTPTGCGNAVVTFGELCDDGNLTDGDGCDSNCTATRCGNGVRTAGELCDDGNATSGDGCDTNCKPTGCRNGVVTTGESCDDGNATNGDGCDNNCTFTRCGNGVRSAGEGCDDGNTTSGDGCDANCTVTGCGNGIATAGEECEDGNLVNGDGCDTNCTITRCGNGVITAPEACDDGNAISGDGCDVNCTVTRCGNGIVAGAEECDDGNTNNTDGCTNACIIQVCGDGDVDAPEACDDGNAINGDGCDTNCTLTACGNGVVTAGEACDDGNPIAFDGCSPQCALEPFELEPNEDGSPSTGASGITGNDFATANADANGAITGSITFGAKIAPAGDEDVFLFRNTTAQPQLVRIDLWSTALGVGVACGTSIDTGLQIRDATGASLASNDNRNSLTDLCSGVTFGLVPGASAYAHVMESGDNAPIAGYVVRAVYTPVPCGNGLVEFGEQCDDGNTSGGDGCSASCQIEVVCGDGLIAPGEQCDDGNATGGDGCSATCQVETTAELEPNNTLADAAASALQLAGDRTIRGALSTGSDVDVYRLAVATSTVVRFETFTSLFDCNASVTLRLYDAAGFQIVEDSEGFGVSGCGALVIFLTPGTYFIRVESRSGASVPSYFLAVDYQLDRGAEAEPGNTAGSNDTTSTASANLLGADDAYVFGDHMLAGDVDVYAITVPGGARIRAELIEGDRPVETCESNGIQSRLTLFNQSLTQVADDLSSGRGLCSLIDGTGAVPLHSGALNNTTVPKTFYLMVRQSTSATANGAAFIYRLQVSFR